MDEGPDESLLHPADTHHVVNHIITVVQPHAETSPLSPIQMSPNIDMAAIVNAIQPANVLTAAEMENSLPVIEEISQPSKQTL